MVADLSRLTRLYTRAVDIQDGKAKGFWLPIMWHLALRGHTDAMIQLANWYSSDKSLGATSDPFSPAGLYRRAYRAGDAMAAGNLALSYFNLNNLRGYRHWLWRAAMAGDVDAAEEIERFETRLPHSTARDIRRHRPVRRRHRRA